MCLVRCIPRLVAPVNRWKQVRIEPVYVLCFYQASIKRWMSALWAPLKPIKSRGALLFKDYNISIVDTCILTFFFHPPAPPHAGDITPVSRVCPGRGLTPCHTHIVVRKTGRILWWTLGRTVAAGDRWWGVHLVRKDQWPELHWCANIRPAGDLEEVTLVGGGLSSEPTYMSLMTRIVIRAKKHSINLSLSIKPGLTTVKCVWMERWE